MAASARPRALAAAALLSLAAAPAIADSAPAGEAPEGLTVSVALTSMVQRAGGGGSADGHPTTRANVRGDLTLTLPAAAPGEAEGQLFAHLRFGRGQGVALRPTFTSSANSTAFELSGVDGAHASFAVLAQAWYQLTLPLSPDGAEAPAGRRLELTVGKLDPFAFFDQNAAADDESTRFVNNVFVHNPLLDSGGDVGADAYGFAPGLRLAYRQGADAGPAWGASLGVFGAGAAARFSGLPGRAFVIGQLETIWFPWRTLQGHWRFYAWHNGEAADADGSTRRHRGWGVSADQAVSDSVRLFGRHGRRTTGHGAFDRATTLGAEISGEAWRRPADGFGVALAWLPAGSAGRGAASDASFAGQDALRAERIAELYYRWHVTDRIELSPDLQWIGRAAAQAGAPGFTVIGLRAKLAW